MSFRLLPKKICRPATLVAVTLSLVYYFMHASTVSIQKHQTDQKHTEIKEAVTNNNNSPHAISAIETRAATSSFSNVEVTTIPTTTTTKKTLLTTLTTSPKPHEWRNQMGCLHIHNPDKETVANYVRLANDCLGIDHQVEHNKNFGSPSATLAECQQACDEHRASSGDEGCNGFSYIRGFGCWLKHGCDGPRGQGMGYKYNESPIIPSGQTKLIVMSAINYTNAFKNWWTQVDSDWCFIHRETANTMQVARTALQFIVDNYHDLPDMMGFVIDLWSLRWDSVPKHLIFSTLPNNISYLPLPAPFTRGVSLNSDPVEIEKFDKTLALTKQQWVDALKMAGEPVVPLMSNQTLYAGNQFIVSKQAVLSRPLKLYEVLLDNQPDSMDRVWHQLFLNEQYLHAELHTKIVKWRVDALKHFCQPWNCSCKNLYAKLGQKTPNKNDRELLHWWQHGSPTRLPYYFLEQETDAHMEYYVKLFLEGRKPPGYGPCLNRPVQQQKLDHKHNNREREAGRRKGKTLMQQMQL